MKKKLAVIALSIMMVSSLTSCNEKINADQGENQIVNIEEKVENSKEENEIPKAEKAKDNPDNMWVPKNVLKVYAIDKPNEMIRDLIAKYYEIPKEEYESTRYYYNYTDLDGDGKQDIFVLIVGPYTSGSGGSSALWLKDRNGKYEINQAFTLVNPPIIVEGKKNQKKSLIMQSYGGGEKPEIVRLNLKGNRFENVSEAKPAGNIENIEAEAIISNDLSKDVENKNALTLDK